ncbi:hypothetical protein G6O67_008472 [Ophiocordyceps sinensis]|uniref:Secreted protein n=1 Tax=Ophiocordyceps sinensis TaxID=72228 RepID=A0A8H4LS88_9HYPO|nr:hypothetical protein G6O67_008472 [Ophiocordyceps sinensis]
MLSLLLLSGLLGVSANPVNAGAELDNQHEIQSRQTASGCGYFSSMRHCIYKVCECAEDRYYLINEDRVKAGGHGCDPPWGFLATGYENIHGFCA